MSDIALLYSDKARVAARMPACERYEHILTPPIIQRPINDDSYIIDIGYEYEVDSDELLPKSECTRIIAEVKRYSTRATMPMACHLAKLLVNRYPEQTIAETTETALINVFGRFPPDIGFEAIDWFSDAGFVRIPGPARLQRHCVRMMEERKYKMRIAKLHLRRHKAGCE
jgi:hypothetical protein